MVVSVDGVDLFEQLDACLARLDRDAWNAVIYRRDAAVRSEAADQRHQSAAGPPAGALAGLCFTAKSAISTGVLPATAGSLLLGEAPRGAAPVITRLRAAGGLLVGATNCAEFALAPIATNRRYGSTANPAAAGHSPGGSSAGCAAAVAGRLVPLSVGSDYGGSVRYPASCTGVLGFRPARRSAPAAGQVPAPPPRSARARFSVPGLLARDLATLTAVLPVFLAHPVAPRPSRRVAWAAGEGDHEVDPKVIDVVRQAAERLGAIPAEECGGNPLAGASKVFDRIRATDDLEPIRTLAAGRTSELTDRIRQILAEPPQQADPIAEHKARELSQRAARFFDRVPVLVAPVTTRPTPLRGDDDIPFAALAPCRAVSLIGTAALCVPTGARVGGAPLGVQLIGRLPELLWAAHRLMP